MDLAFSLCNSLEKDFFTATGLKIWLDSFCRSSRTIITSEVTEVPVSIFLFISGSGVVKVRKLSYACSSSFLHCSKISIISSSSALEHSDFSFILVKFTSDLKFVYVLTNLLSIFIVSSLRKSSIFPLKHLNHSDHLTFWDWVSWGSA